MAYARGERITAAGLNSWNVGNVFTRSHSDSYAGKSHRTYTTPKIFNRFALRTHSYSDNLNHTKGLAGAIYVAHSNYAGGYFDVIISDGNSGGAQYIYFFHRNDILHMNTVGKRYKFYNYKDGGKLFIEIYTSRGGFDLYIWPSQTDSIQGSRFRLNNTTGDSSLTGSRIYASDLNAYKGGTIKYR